MILLKVDIDNADPMPRGRMKWLLARAGFRLIALTARRSPSGQGWHLNVNVAPVVRRTVPLAEVVALQCILGSDPAREACNLTRARTAARRGGKYLKRWNVFYSRSFTFISGDTSGDTWEQTGEPGRP